jgi:hypothetical protein
LLAIVSCDQRRLSRHLRTCGPIRLSLVFINREKGSGFPRRQLFPTWAQMAEKSACRPTGKSVRHLCVGETTIRPNERHETWRARFSENWSLRQFASVSPHSVFHGLTRHLTILR